MAPSNAVTRPGQATEKVREHLMTSLHLGRLRPGDRVASVRRLADITGLNRKTVHRAYGALVKEGFLDARPGAGTFVAQPPGTRASQVRFLGQLGAAPELASRVRIVVPGRLRAELAYDLAAKHEGHA